MKRLTHRLRGLADRLRGFEATPDELAAHRVVMAGTFNVMPHDVDEAAVAWHVRRAILGGVHASCTLAEFRAAYGLRPDIDTDLVIGVDDELRGLLAEAERRIPPSPFE